jgi:hypothetical protein
VTAGECLKHADMGDGISNHLNGSDPAYIAVLVGAQDALDARDPEWLSLGSQNDEPDPGRWVRRRVPPGASSEAAWAWPDGAPCGLAAIEMRLLTSIKMDHDRRLRDPPRHTRHVRLTSGDNEWHWIRGFAVVESA